MGHPSPDRIHQIHLVGQKKYPTPKFGIANNFPYINTMSKTTTKVTRRTGSNITKTATRRTNYEAVSNNIYFDGTSYRVRVSKNKVKYTKNFSSKRQAMAYRKALLAI